MDRSKRRLLRTCLALFAPCCPTAARATPAQSNDAPVTDYMAGLQDVLTITSRDQADRSGKFTIVADGSGRQREPFDLDSLRFELLRAGDVALARRDAPEPIPGAHW